MSPLEDGGSSIDRQISASRAGSAQSAIHVRTFIRLALEEVLPLNSHGAAILVKVHHADTTPAAMPCLTPLNPRLEPVSVQEAFLVLGPFEDSSCDLRELMRKQ